MSFPSWFLTDDSAITCKGFCTISWNLKADVLDGYLIFVTGDPVTLGCWESDMAVKLSPSVENNNVWMAEIKVIPLPTQIVFCQILKLDGTIRGHFAKFSILSQ